jgi:raffinose/stachyose/melibiose transport system substrate-binding protein
MKKKWAYLAAVAAATSLALAGCSDPSASTAATGGSSDAAATQWAESTADLTGVELTIWTAQSTATVPDGVIAAFEKATGAKVTNVTVPDAYESNVQTRLATGDKPDLMFWQTTESMLKVIQAQTSLQHLDGAPWADKIDPSAQNLGVMDGVHYAAPLKAADVMGVYYNKADFAKAGITETPKGWDGLMAAARKLKDAGVAAPFYEAGGDKWPTQWGAQILLADVTAGGFYDRLNANKDSFTNPDVVAQIASYESIFTGGLGNENVRTATFADQADALMSGDAAMEFHIGALVDQIAASHDLAEIDKTIGFFPISPSGNVGTTISAQANTVVAYATGDAKREAASRQLLRFWLEDYYPTFIAKQAYVSIQPAVPSPTGIPQATIDASPTAVAKTVPSMQEAAIVNPDLYLNLTDLLFGAKTPAQVAEATQSQFVQIAKAQGAAGF